MAHVLAGTNDDYIDLNGTRTDANNYEDGDGPDSRFARIMPIVKEHGASVIALTIDEEGQFERKC